MYNWSTVVGANTPYMFVDPSCTSVGDVTWNNDTLDSTVTGFAAGDLKIRLQILYDDSQSPLYTAVTNQVIIPDIVGDTAFVQNVGTGRYIDLEQVNYVPTDVVQQWSFHGGTQSLWIFELGGSGYFKIKSVKTGKYIGVDSADTTKVKQYTTVTDYTLWKLTETSNGRYKIFCKASALSGKVLSTPTSTSTNGADLTMLAYVSDSDYKDEWRIYHLQNIIDGVPTALQSNDAHLCIPCAITNIAGYWSLNGYSQFGCSTADQQETVAIAVQAKMQQDYDAPDGHKANNAIQHGFNYFSHTENNRTYLLQSQKIWIGEPGFSSETIAYEIDSGRPLMIGFANTSDSPFGSNSGHMTVCVGYEWNGSEVYLYLSDAWHSSYSKFLFKPETYNDFIAIVEVNSD